MANRRCDNLDEFVCSKAPSVLGQNMHVWRSSISDWAQVGCDKSLAYWNTSPVKTCLKG